MVFVLVIVMAYIGEYVSWILAISLIGNFDMTLGTSWGDPRFLPIIWFNTLVLLLIGTTLIVVWKQSLIRKALMHFCVFLIFPIS